MKIAQSAAKPHTGCGDKSLAISFRVILPPSRPTKVCGKHVGGPHVRGSSETLLKEIPCLNIQG